MPGAADRVFALTEAEADSRNEVSTRTAKGEQFATIASSVTAPAIQFLSIAATVWLGLSGHGGVAALTSIPFVGLSITQLTIVFNRQRHGGSSSRE